MAYLVSETERVFPGAAGSRRVLYTQTGVRPLPHQPRAAEGAITRRHICSAIAPRAGCTRSSAANSRRTARSRRTRCTKCATSFPGPWSRSSTRDRPLPGALPTAERDELLSALRGRFGERQARRLWHVYGKFAADIAALAARPELAEPLADGALLTAELVYALTTEWAESLEDLLQRRCMAGLGADFGVRAAPAAAGALVRLGIWDAARAAHELAGYRELAARHCAGR